MPVDMQRLQHLRSLSQAARCDDLAVSMTDDEVDELVSLERQHAAEQSAIRSEIRQEAEQRKEQERQAAQKKAASVAAPYSSRPSSRMSGLDMIRRGLGHG